MKISKNWKSPLKNLLGCRETNGRVSRTGDVTGYNKRFAVHSVAKETVPFSAWKQSRGLLSWSISVVGAQAKGRTSNSSSRCATASSYARNVAVLLPLYQPREWDEGEGEGEGEKIVGSKHAPSLFRFHVNFVSPWSEMPRVRVDTIYESFWELFIGIPDGRMWMDGSVARLYHDNRLTLSFLINCLWRCG